MQHEALSPQLIESISEGFNIDGDDGKESTQKSEDVRFLRSPEARESIKKIRTFCSQLSPLRCAGSPPRIALRIDYGWLDPKRRPCDSGESELFQLRTPPQCKNGDSVVPLGSCVLGFMRVSALVRMCEDGGSVWATQTPKRMKTSKSKEQTKVSPRRQPKPVLALPEDPWRRKLLLKLSLKLWLQTLEWASLDSCRLSIQSLNDHLGVNVPRDVCESLFKKLFARKVVYVEEGARYVDFDIIEDEESMVTAQLQTLQSELESGARSMGSEASNE